MDYVVSLEDLFSKRLFRVPDYQRGYSWEARQVQEFLEDLDLLGHDRYHYTGTVVLNELNGGPKRMDKEGKTYVAADIVDGQQRLTTIVLLLDAIHRSLSDFSDSAQELSRGIEKNYISTREMNGQPLFKLSLNKDTDHFFKSSILAKEPGVEGPKITSERRLAEAKKQIRNYLDDKIALHGAEGEEWLLNLYAKVATQLRFTFYQVEGDAEVGVIFEVMNDRGKPLTDLEKVKNFLLYVSTALDVPNELSMSVNEAWGEILRRLMAADLVSSNNEDQLLRAHWLTRYNPQSRLWKGSRSIKDEFDRRRYTNRHEELLRGLHSYTEGLRESSVSFCDVFAPHRTDAFQSFKNDPRSRAQVIEWSEKLRRVNVLAPFLPLLLATRERWPDDPRKYLAVLKLCEAFAFRVYRLGEFRANAGQAALFRLGYDMSRKSVDFDGAVLRLRNELAYWCSNDVFIDLANMNHQRWSDAYGWGGLRYFLYEYENHLASDQGASPIVTWDELRKRDLQDTIEHILPQSIDQKPYWQERFQGQNHPKYLHDLGNLTLTKHNSYYLNKPFLEKKGTVDAQGHCYAKSPLYVERELTIWHDWTISTIEERRSRLLEWAKERWSVNLADIDGTGRGPDLPEDELFEDIA